MQWQKRYLDIVLINISLLTPEIGHTVLFYRMCIFGEVFISVPCIFISLGSLFSSYGCSRALYTCVR